jgi:hypothetical protein
MGTTSLEAGCRATQLLHTAGAPGALLTAMLWAMSLVGCGPVEPGEADTLAQQPQAQRVDNGLAYNGLAYNGLAYNGLAYNGLAYNGLAYNGLSTADFQAWFAGDRALADQVMQYVVRCALPETQTLTYTDPTTNQSYTWTGSLGLAPGWASGAPATPQEQQVITACLAAHVNKYGQHVRFSVLGRDAARNEIPTTAPELLEYSQREACFFGNLFTGEGIYVGNDRGLFDARESTSRACSLLSPAGGDASLCPPIIRVGSCTQFCSQEPLKGFYKSCTYNGVSYMPLTTRLRTLDISLCGDGVCQVSESCGTGHQFFNCGVDCGPCN